MAAVEPSAGSSEPAAGTAPDSEAATAPDREPATDTDREPATHTDDRADRMLVDPRGYFARARERARAEIARDIECEIRRLRSP